MKALEIAKTMVKIAIGNGEEQAITYYQENEICL